MRARRQGARNLALAAAGAGFMLGLALAVNPGHYGAIGSVVALTGIAAQVLQNNKVRLEDVREDVLELLCAEVTPGEEVSDASRNGVSEGVFEQVPQNERSVPRGPASWLAQAFGAQRLMSFEATRFPARRPRYRGTKGEPKWNFGAGRSTRTKPV